MVQHQATTVGLESKTLVEWEEEVTKKVKDMTQDELDKIRKYRRDYYYKNRERLLADQAKWYKESGYCERRKEITTAEAKKRYNDTWTRKNMGYVAVRSRMRKIGVKTKELPSELLEAMIACYELNKKLKESRNGK